MHIYVYLTERKTCLCGNVCIMVITLLFVKLKGELTHRLNQLDYEQIKYAICIQRSVI